MSIYILLIKLYLISNITVLLLTYLKNTHPVSIYVFTYAHVHARNAASRRKRLRPRRVHMPERARAQERASLHASCSHMLHAVTNAALTL